MNLLTVSEINQQKARRIIDETGIVDIWKSVGADAQLVGSLRTGLLVDNLDIDFHIYSDSFVLADSFAAIAKLAENPRIKRVEYANLLNTEEECLEWHAWYNDEEDNLWQIDMIHILKESPYAGYFEKVADRIAAVLTPETKAAILEIKSRRTPEVKIMGIEIYQAVIRDGVRTFEEFRQWQEEHPNPGIVDWMP